LRTVKIYKNSGGAKNSSISRQRDFNDIAGDTYVCPLQNSLKIVAIRANESLGPNRHLTLKQRNCLGLSCLIREQS